MARLPGRPRFFRFPWRSGQEIREEVDEELSFHIEMRCEELWGRGMNRGEARRQAMREFGDLEGARSSLSRGGLSGERRRRRWNMLQEFGQDIRYAARTLANRPGFLTVSVLVLGLGIGVNAAMFSLVNLLLLRPVKIDQPERLVGLYSQSVERPEDYRSFSYPELVEIRDQNRVFDDVVAHTITMVGLREGEVTRRLIAGVVSANYFETFGVPLERGRGFLAEEERPGSAAGVAVVSHQFWKRRGSAPGIVGSSLHLNGHVVTVVGVTAEGFTGTTALFSPEVWLPLGLYGTVTSDLGATQPRRLDDPSNYFLMAVGRLAPEIALDEANVRLAALAERLQESHPEGSDSQTLKVARPPRLSISTDPEDDSFLIAPAILMMAMTGVVLLIACLNLANMFLARGATRRTEMAIRASLGGGRARLVRQLMTEGLLLSILGGAVGLALAYGGTRLLFSSVGTLIPFGISLHVDHRPDPTVLVVTLVICVVATLFFCLGPALKVTSGVLLAALKEGGKSDAGRKGIRLAPRNLLIVGQVALSLTLLTAGGLFIRGAFEAAEATPGFSLDDSVLVEIDPSLVGRDESGGREVYRELIERLRGTPGVAAVGASSIVPFGSVTSRRAVREAGDVDDGYASVSANNYIVTDQYFSALRLPILRGRDFTATESRSPEGVRVAIVDEPLVSQLWPEQEAVGKYLQIEASSTRPVSEPILVVGVVPGIKHQFWDPGPTPHLYLPFGQQYVASMNLHVRLFETTDDGEAAMLQTLREQIRAYDPVLPVLTLKTMRDFRDQALFVWLVRSGARVFTVLGVLALFLALVGVYGVRAFLMARRTREIGLRMALGATPRLVLADILKEGAAVTLAGLVLGLVLALATARLLSNLLYQVSATDPAVFLSAALLLAAAATLASYLPARRATKIAPTEALRYE